MADSLDRLEAFVNLAVDQGTTEEERRTAAVAACKLLHELDIIINLKKLANVFRGNERLMQGIIDGRIQIFARRG